MDADLFSVELVHDGGTARLVLAGELDIAGVPAFTGAIPDMSPGELLIIDLRELSFIDSSGIHVLMRLDTAARGAGWTLALVRGRPAVQRVLDLCRLGDQIPIADTPEAIGTPSAG